MATPKNLSVQKAFALLCSFDNPEEWLSNAKLSRRAGMTEASAHRLIRTLEGIGAVVRDVRGNYWPGTTHRYVSWCRVRRCIARPHRWPIPRAREASRRLAASLATSRFHPVK